LEKVSILDALGRVLGEDIVAERDNPPWNNSAMDGFAVRWDDIKQEHAVEKTVTLTIIEDVPAGKMPTKSVGPGQAIRIMTGAPIPQWGGHRVESGRHRAYARFRSCLQA
jgi:molybdopterin molybdotransferase